MTFTARDAYLDTRVSTATPQRLRLMLIDEALRQARLAATAAESGETGQAGEPILRCREVVTELIAGIRPDESSLAKQVLGIYLFLYSALTESRVTPDHGRLADVIRVLEEERITWDEICQRFPVPIDGGPASAGPAEEVAPQRVTAKPSGYAPSSCAPAAAFSIEA